MYIPFFRESELVLPIGKSVLKLSQHTDYPFEGKVRIDINENTAGAVSLKMLLPLHTSGHRLSYNGEETTFMQEGQFAIFGKDFKQGDYIELTFAQNIEIVMEKNNQENAFPDQLRIFYGILMLGCENNGDIKLSPNEKIVRSSENTFGVAGKDIVLTPVYHLMDSIVWKGTNYKKQILF
ncbi:hypothetical protein EZS27_027808 [termite gut metagenome]|uniref:Non-reducing end beta-L-arabinofuranosidase-like GH127 middle domain-containing protein n=1 Tax=termite gut metagenome TaxID=433724 RepID=A0A5J4QNT3_9ZZZZ